MSDLEKFYVYLLLDPTNFYLPFYIGKGSGARWKKHLQETLKTTSNARKFHRIQKIRSQGLEPKVMFWQTNMFEEEAYDLETKLIERFGRKRYDNEGILENLVPDARPPGLTRCQNREAVLAKMRGRTGEKNSFFGRTHSDEWKKTNSDRHRGKEISVEHRRAISEKMTNRVMSQEHKARIGSAHKGRPKSPEAVAKMVATRKANGSFRGPKKCQK